jgi:putative peptide zinc metalloprotease protein
MADAMTAMSPLQALVPSMDNMVAALQKPKPPDQSTYEGNIATPANPLNDGTYGQPAAPPPTPPPPTAGAMPPVNPFTQGARPSPFLNTSALFGQPPMAGSPSPFGMPMQRPNPTGQMQL